MLNFSCERVPSHKSALRLNFDIFNRLQWVRSSDGWRLQWAGAHNEDYGISLRFSPYNEWRESESTSEIHWLTLSTTEASQHLQSNRRIFSFVSRRDIERFQDRISSGIRISNISPCSILSFWLFLGRSLSLYSYQQLLYDPRYLRTDNMFLHSLCSRKRIRVVCTQGSCG